MINPDGYVYTWTTERLWRKNRTPVGGGYYGVDLNRNYGYQWGQPGSSPDPKNNQYRGPTPFSEPETRAIRDLVLSRSFGGILDFHNYSQLILWPWGYTTAPCPDASVFAAKGAQIASIIYSVHGVNYTPEQASQLYICSGITIDWTYGDRGIPSYTIELRPQAWPYFELPPNENIPTFEENLPVAFDLMDWTISKHPTVGIEVFSNLQEASFDITGPSNHSGSGTHWLALGIQNGEYSISWKPVPGWLAPAPSSGSVESNLLVFEGDYTLDYRSIAELKTRPDGEPVAAQGKIVTAVMGDVFYIEEPDKSAGIRVVKSNHGLSVGVTVRTIIGTIRTSAEGERYIQASEIEKGDNGTIRELYMPCRSIGGGDFLVSGVGQRGITGASGLNNIGLLIGTWGTITSLGDGYL